MCSEFEHLKFNPPGLGKGGATGGAKGGVKGGVKGGGVGGGVEGGGVGGGFFANAIAIMKGGDGGGLKGAAAGAARNAMEGVCPPTGEEVLDGLGLPLAGGARRAASAQAKAGVCHTLLPTSSGSSTRIRMALDDAAGWLSSPCEAPWGSMNVKKKKRSEPMCGRPWTMVIFMNAMVTYMVGRCRLTL